ncbi:MAG: hypothetical protein ABI797_01095 [Chloroflexota bacterium]
MTNIWRHLAALVGALALVACGAAQPSQPVTITLLPGSPIGTPQPTATLGAATAEIELTLGGGPANGSYRAVIHGTSCIQPSSEQLIANYADPTAADGFTALDLDLRDAAAAIEADTDDFALSITVSGTTIVVDPTAGQGEGTALLEIDELDMATLDLFASAPDGTEVALSLLCDVEPL